MLFTLAALGRPGGLRRAGGDPEHHLDARHAPACAVLLGCAGTTARIGRVSSGRPAAAEPAWPLKGTGLGLAGSQPPGKDAHLDEQGGCLRG